jgi:hypothetical protein
MRALTFILALSAFAVPALAQDLPVEQVRVQQIQYRGTGCKPGSVATNLAPDAQALTMMFADYRVETGSRDGRPARKSCDLDVTMSVPSGWSFALLAYQVRGYASLERGVVATQGTSLLARHNGRRQEMGSLDIRGAYDDTYMNSVETPMQLLNWSACGAASSSVTFNTFISVRPQQGFRPDQGERDDPRLGRALPQGMITIDSVDHTVNTLYAFTWRKCDDDGSHQTPADVTATCMLHAGNRQFRERATDDDQARAKIAATTKVVDACRLGMRGRPDANRACQPERVLCSYVRDRHGPGNTHGHPQRGGGPGGPGRGPGGPGPGPGHGPGPGGPGHGPGPGGPGHGPGPGGPGHGPGPGGPGHGPGPGRPPR